MMVWLCRLLLTWAFHRGGIKSAAIRATVSGNVVITFPSSAFSATHTFRLCPT